MKPAELRSKLSEAAARLERYVISGEDVPENELDQYYVRDFLSHRSDVAFLVETARKVAEGLAWYDQAPVVR